MREGYFKEVELKGIARAMSNDVSVEGVCDDMLNLRYENGSWKPMETPKQVFNMGEDVYHGIWIHTGPDYRHALGKKDGRLYWFADIDTDGTWKAQNPAVDLCDVTDEELCSENGNLVTVGGRVFKLWNKSKNEYVDYTFDTNGNETDENLNPDGKIDFRVVQDLTDDGEPQVLYVAMDEKYDNGTTKYDETFTNGNISDEAKTFSRTGYTSLERAHRSKNSFCGAFLVCSALKTYNGDYVLASRPQLMYPQSYIGNVDRITNATWVSGSGGASYNPGDILEIDKMANDTFGFISDNIVGSEYVDRDNDDFTYIGHYRTSADRIEALAKASTNSVQYVQWCRTTSCKVKIKKEMLPTLTDHVVPVYSGKAEKNHKYFGSKTKLQIKVEGFSESSVDVYNKICVFMTPVESLLDYNNYELTNLSDVLPFSNFSTNWKLHPTKRDREKVVKKLKGYCFYKLAEVEVGSSNGEWVDVDIEDGVLLNLVQQEILPADTTTRNGINARGSYPYNGRLHLFDYDSTLFHGWPLNYFFENEVLGCLPVKTGRDNDYKGSTAHPYLTEWLNAWQGELDYPSWYIAVEIEKEGGKSRVVRYAPFEQRTDKLHGYGVQTYAGFPSAYAREIMSLNACLSYPDTRAKKMTIYVKSQTYTYGSANQPVTYVKMRAYDLEPHLRLNCAMYIDPDLKPIDIVPTQFDYDTNIIQDDKIAPDEVNNATRYENGLKVSAVDNPLYFPAENTYRVGNRGIVGMMANEVAVGTGQTGDAPLMVFCKDGVYGLFVDSSGKLAYNYSRPLSSDICNNANSIRRVDGGIVFGTDRGLMMFKGTEVADIGEICEGRPIRFFDITATEFVSTLNGAFTHNKIGDFGSSVTTGEDFREYLRGCEVGYNYPEKETIVSRPDRDYYYQKTFDGKWGRVEGRLAEIVDTYPECFVVEGNKIYDVDRYKGEGARRVFFLTRPISGKSVGRDAGDQYKENYRVVVKGEFDSGEDILGLYVVGSYDGKRWSVLGGNERQGKFSDLGCLVERVDVRYIMICLSGTIGKDGCIDSILVESRYK